MESFEILRIKGDSRETVQDLVAEEVPFTINLNSKELVTLLSTPQDLKELVIGFLFKSRVFIIIGTNSSDKYKVLPVLTTSSKSYSLKFIRLVFATPFGSITLNTM